MLRGIISHLPELFGSLLIGILFVQSAVDKIFDWKGNMEWLTGHFSKTIFAKTVPPMLAALTLMELATGLLSLAGIVWFLAVGSTIVIFCSATLGASTIIALFMGQRVAKDYPGAAILVPYFLLLIVVIYLTKPSV
ncbi:MAG: DoxX family protein [Acidobacteriota bacterium]